MQRSLTEFELLVVYDDSEIANGWEVGTNNENIAEWIDHYSINNYIENDPNKDVVHHYAMFTLKPEAATDNVLGIAYLGTACLANPLCKSNKNSRKNQITYNS